MKKIIALLVSLLLVFSLVACSNGEHNDGTESKETKSESQAETKPADTTEAEPENDITIGFALNTLDEYQNTILQYARAYCEANGVTLVETNAEGSIEKQVSDLESLATQDVDCVLVNCLDPDGLVSAVEQLVDQGIPVVEGGYKINTDKAPSIGTSRYAMGEIQYQYLASYLDENPDATLNIGYLWGYETVKGCQDMYAGLFENLEKNYSGRYTIVAEVATNFSVETAISTVEAWMTSFPEMNCIVSQNDEMIVGAINVYEAAAADAERMIMIGCDGSENAMTYLENGTLDATVYTDLKYLTEVKIGYCISAAKGESLPTEDIEVSEATKLLTKDNMGDVTG